MKKFNVGIKAVIVNDGKVLLLKKAGKGFWEVPGGRIDDEETIEQTLKRELHEELPNIQDFEVGELLHAHRLSHDIGPDLGLVLIFYRVRATFDGEPQFSNEHAAYRWASKDEALELVDVANEAAVKKALA